MTGGNSGSNSDSLITLKVKGVSPRSGSEASNRVYTFKEWPKSTGVWCWWCCHPFDTIPVAIPEKFVGEKEVRSLHIDLVSKSREFDEEDIETRPAHFKVWGNFCSFECAAAHIKSERGNSSGDMTLLLWLRTHMTSLKISDRIPIKPAPSRYVLKAFGGNIDIEEFRAASAARIEYNLLKYPLCPIGYDIEKIDRKQTVPKALDLIKRRRPKTSTIDSFLECSANALLS